MRSAGKFNPISDETLPFAARFIGPGGHSVLPGGFGKALTVVGPWSPMAVRAEGWRLWDDRGNELIDLHGNFTVNVHGNAHPTILAAIGDAARTGLSFGLPNLHEIDHALRLLDRLPGLNQVRYTNSGSEATQLAARLARAHTGRPGVIVVSGSYHGWGETVLPTLGPRAERGIPAGMRAETLVVGFDDADGLEATVAAAPGRFAAIMLDLLPNRIGIVQPSDAFIQAARRLCDQHGIALIVDEVISFRLAKGGLTATRGVGADLVCLGKMVGGGLPVGALVGKAEWMGELDPTSPNALEHGGTFSANPVTMAAGVAALDLLDDEALSRIDALGRRFRHLLSEPLARYGWEPRGLASLSRLYPAFARGDEVIEQQRRLWWALHERGVLIAKHGVCGISTVMDATVVDRAAEAVEAAVSRLG